MKKGAMIFVAFVFAAILSFGIVSAYRGNFEDKSPYYSEERCDAMTSAFDGTDYSAWKELMMESGRNTRVLEVVNEDNFPLFVEMHDAMKSGDVETANALREELGLRNGAGLKDGEGFKAGNQNPGQKQGFGRNAGNGQSLRLHATN